MCLLRKMQAKLEGVKTVIEKMADTPATPGQIPESLEEGLKVVPGLPAAFIKLHVFKTHMAKLLEDFKLVEIANSLGLTEQAMRTEGDGLTLSLTVDPLKHDETQTAWLLKALCEALRTENKLDMVACFINQVSALQKRSAPPSPPWSEVYVAKVISFLFGGCLPWPFPVFGA